MSGLSFTTLRPDTLTWETADRLFTLRCKSQNLSPRTQTLYAEKLAGFRSWLAENGGAAPAEVLPTHLRAFLETRKARGNSDQTIDGCYRILRTFFGFLHRDGLLLLNPLDKVERPRRERRFVRPFTVEQLRTLLAHINTKRVLGLRDYALILFLADTGLRLSEALALKEPDIDWAHNSILVFGKGRKERRVAFGQTARKALLGWLKHRGVIESCSLIWVSRYGEALTRYAVAQRMKQHTRRAGIAAKRLSPHALRHFFALQFLKNGGDVMSLQKLLGHSSLHMVRSYVNLTDDDALTRHRNASPLDKLGPLPGESRHVVVK